MERDFLEERKLMVARQLRGHGISDRRVLEAFESIPRHLFVPQKHQDEAYEDGPLPIGFQQTISQPFIVAYMTQALGLEGNERALEVGTGSGYQAAILSALVPEVHTVELIPALADRARKTLEEIGVRNVFVHVGDGSLGWAEAAPYDAVMVSAAAPHVPQSLLDQLADGGRMILPVGERGDQVLELWRRDGESFTHEDLLPVAFVPLRGRDGV
jgi:protein-L-isoaspartate(D-aspartate) O-methyltransferase